MFFFGIIIRVPIFIWIVFCIRSRMISAWVTPSSLPVGANPIQSIRSSHIEVLPLYMSSADDPKKNDDEESEVEWGVSYIGGDPCGSKYNTDPFHVDNDVQKPGMPDDMKARIAAMAEKRLRDSEEQATNIKQDAN